MLAPWFLQSDLSRLSSRRLKEDSHKHREVKVCKNHTFRPGSLFPGMYIWFTLIMTRVSNDEVSVCTQTSVSHKLRLL